MIKCVSILENNLVNQEETLNLNQIKVKSRNISLYRLSI